MAKRRRSPHSSHHLGQWQRFQTPQLLVQSDQPDEINVFGPIATQDTADFWQWWFETDYHTGDVEFQQALLASQSQSVKIIINSPGGDVWAGSAIRSFIQTEIAKGRTFETHIVGVAASAASIIALAAPKIIIADMGMFMIHRAAVPFDAWGYGNEDDLQIAINDFESRKQSLREINEAQIKIFMEKTGKSREDMRELLRKETWLNAQSAIEAGFCDEVQPSGIELPPIADKPVPSGFHRTAHGGFAHDRPAYSFAAAIGLGKADPDDDEEEDDLTGTGAAKPKAKVPVQPPTPTTTQGVSSMYDAQIRKALGLSADVEITPAHLNQYISMISGENAELKTELGKTKQKAVLDKAKATFKAHVERGAITPQQSVQTLSLIMGHPDPEEQLTLQDEIYQMLPDGDDPDDPGATARKPRGEGKTAKGAEGDEDDDRSMAWEFNRRMQAKIKAGMEVSKAQDATGEDLVEKFGQTKADKIAEAYMHHDFDADDKGDPGQGDD